MYQKRIEDMWKWGKAVFFTLIALVLIFGMSLVILSIQDRNPGGVELSDIMDTSSKESLQHETFLIKVGLQLAYADFDTTMLNKLIPKTLPKGDDIKIITVRLKDGNEIAIGYFDKGDHYYSLFEGSIIE